MVTVVVQGLSIDTQNDGERHGSATRQREAFDYACNLLLDHAWLTHLHGSGVHVIGCVGGTLHLGDFEFALHLTHGDDRLDEFEAGIFSYLINRAAEPFGTLDFGVATIGGQHVNLASFGDGLLQIFAKLVKVAAVGDADTVALFLQ